MSFSYALIQMLQCDQGMGNLIKIYDSNQDLTNLVLVDLGAENGSRGYAQDAVTAVVDALEEMEYDGQDAYLDMLVVSHQDFDHWSLIPDLHEKIKAALDDGTLESFQIGRVVVGGREWRDAAETAVFDFAVEFDAAVDELPDPWSDYLNPGAGATKIDDWEGVVFRTLAVNATVNRKGLDLIRNGTSAVIVVELGKWKVILPGDATANTMGWINKIVADWTKATGASPIANTFVLSVPHHGALRTFADNFTTKNPKLDIGTTFAQNTSAQIVGASAGKVAKFKHPYKRVLDLLAWKAGTKRAAHDYVNYDEAAGDWQVVPGSTKGIFTTMTSLTDPPARRSWQFRVNSAGALAAQVIRLGGPPEPPSWRLGAEPGGPGRPVEERPAERAVRPEGEWIELAGPDEPDAGADEPAPSG